MAPAAKTARPQAARPRPAAATPTHRAVQGRVLDPATATVSRRTRSSRPARPSYVGPRLTISQVGRRRRRPRGAERRSPSALGWTVGARAGGPADRRSCKFGLRTVHDQRRLRPRRHRAGRLDAAAADPGAVRRRDAVARRRASTTSSSRAGRSSANPFHDAQPVPRRQPVPRQQPGRRRPDAAGTDRELRVAGSGGRQPVAYVGPPPRRVRRRGLPGPPAGRRHPRHRLRRAPVAGRGRRQATSSSTATSIGYDDAADRSRGATATWSARSTA